MAKWKDENLLLDLRKEVVIDGFKVEAFKIHKLTVNWMLKFYRKFNKKYFNNELPDLEDRLYTYTSSSPLGIVVVKHWTYSNAGKTEYKAALEGLGISTFLDLSEKDFCDVLLHEMIHVWQYTRLPNPLDREVKNYLGHGKDFLEKMNYINSFGWDLSVTFNKSDLYKVYDKKLSDRVIFVVFKKQNKFYGIITKEDTLPYIENNGYRVQGIYSVLDVNFLKKNFSFFDDTSFIQQFNLAEVSENDVKELISKEKIKPRKVRESIESKNYFGII